MPQPDKQQVHIDAPLTNVSIAVLQEETNFVSKQVFPIVPVDKQSDKYYIFDKQSFLRDDVQRRPPGTESAGSGYTVSNATYTCDVFALHKDIDDQTRANTDGALGSPDRAATTYLTHQMLQRMEQQWVADFFVTSVWGSTVTPSNLWSDYAASDPVTDLELGVETILSNTGLRPNTLVLGYQVWRQLKHHPDIVDRIKGGATVGSPAVVTRQAVAAIFEVDRLLVAQAVKATNVEYETAAYAFTHGKHALLCYTPATPGLMTPAAGYTFMWRGVSSGLGETVGVSSFRMEELKSDRVEIEAAFDNKIVSSDLGYFFLSAVA